MSALFISLLTLVLILISVFVVFLVLMQKSQSGGMGSAFGGGMAESAFGSDTSNVLTRATIYTTIAFFIIALILYLMYQTNASDQEIGWMLSQSLQLLKLPLLKKVRKAKLNNLAFSQMNYVQGK